MAGDEPTPYELLRAVNDLRGDMRSGFADVNTRLDRVPSTELLGALLTAINQRIDSAEQDIAEIKAKRDQDAAARAVDRRWLIGLAITSSLAILVPIVIKLIDLGRAAT